MSPAKLRCVNAELAVTASMLCSYVVVQDYVLREQVEGRAHFSKAAMLCPWLKYPITNLGGSVHLADSALMV